MPVVTTERRMLVLHALVALVALVATACTLSPSEATPPTPPTPPTRPAPDTRPQGPDGPPTPAGPPLPRASASADSPNLVVVDIDSLRADTLLARTDDGSPVAPTIARLAEHGVFLSGGIAQAGWTLPSVTSALTGRYPPVFDDDSLHDSPTPGGGHEMRWMTPGMRTLPSILQMYGYSTAVVWGLTIPSMLPVLNHGFDEFHPNRNEGMDLPGAPDAYHQPVLDWIARGPSEPFMLFLHNVDLHRPDPLPPDTLRHPHDDGVDDCIAGDIDEVAEHARGQVDEATADRHLVDYYRAALTWYDRSLGIILEGLDAAALTRPVVILVTSDHGELLGEHGMIGHGKAHYDEVLTVPLLVVDPRTPQTGQRVTATFETIDLAPTVLDLAGVPLDHNMPGVPLTPLVEGRVADWTPPQVYSLTNLWAASLRTDHFELALHQPRHPDGGAERADTMPPMQPGIWPELSDLQQDPGEARDVSSTHPDVRAAMQRGSWRPAAAPAPQAPR